MPSTITTLTVRPDVADDVRPLREERECPSINAALRTMLEEVSAE